MAMQSLFTLFISSNKATTLLGLYTWVACKHILAYPATESPESSFKVLAGVMLQFCPQAGDTQRPVLRYSGRFSLEKLSSTSWVWLTWFFTQFIHVKNTNIIGDASILSKHQHDVYHHFYFSVCNLSMNIYTYWPVFCREQRLVQRVKETRSGWTS